MGRRGTIKGSQKDNRPSSVKRSSIPDGVIENAKENAKEDRITRRWKRGLSLHRAVRIWESAFGVIDMRELNLISAWTAHQNVMECLPPERILSYESFKYIIKRIMIPLGHAYSVPQIELSRMDQVAMSPTMIARASFIVVNSQCLPLYVWYLLQRPEQAGIRSAHSVDNFLKIIQTATPEELDKVFSVRYDHMWLSRFPSGYHDIAWTWNGRVWDGNGDPREVTLSTLHPTINGLSYEETYIRERHRPLNKFLAKDESNETDGRATETDS